MPLYESVFIVRQDIPAAQVETLSTSFADIVQAQGGKVTKTEQWGLRSLAYRINKNKKGHYVLFNLDAPPAAVTELERNLRLNEDILRFLTVRVETLEEGPSAILRKDERSESGFGDREFRSDRPRRAPRRDDSTDSEGTVA
ncbi:MAG: 30S ribosomal protein S6 [Alphaproteobacteria bacterium]|nr:30S ribosomal protein S6 [Alphaproteobacteria bacterium]